MHLSKSWATKEGHIPRNDVQLEKISGNFTDYQRKNYTMHITVCMNVHIHLCILKEIKNLEIEGRYMTVIMGIL